MVAPCDCTVQETVFYPLLTYLLDLKVSEEQFPRAIILNIGSGTY